MLIDVRWHIAWILLLIWVLFFCITSSCSSGIDKKELANGQKIISHTKETLTIEIIDSTKINIEEAKKHTLEEAEMIFGSQLRRTYSLWMVSYLNLELRYITYFKERIYQINYQKIRGDLEKE